jgi:hypothetical protein
MEMSSARLHCSHIHPGAGCKTVAWRTTAEPLVLGLIIVNSIQALTPNRALAVELQAFLNTT